MGEYLNYSKPTGTCTCTPAQARQIMVALATGIHPWADGWDFQSVFLPGTDKGWQKERTEAIAEGQFDQEDAVGFWAPNVRPIDGGLRWSPWNSGTESYSLRWVEVRIVADRATITWDTGTGEPSRFIGSLVGSALWGQDSSGSLIWKNHQAQPLSI